MVDKFLRDLIPFLAPEYAICPRSRADVAERCITEALQIKGYGPMDWKNFPQHKALGGPSDIIVTIEGLLGRQLEKTEQTVYFLSDDNPGYVIKTRLELLLKNYANMPWSGAAWMWNPELGYVVEDRHWGDIIVGLIPKQDGLNAYFTTRKGAVLRTEARRHALVERLMHPVDYATIGVVGGITANQLLAVLVDCIPFTNWGHVDWARIDKKMLIGAEVSRIQQAFEQLSGRLWDATTVLYVQLNDPDMQLFRTTLIPILARLSSLQELAYEIFLFDEEMHYIVEIDALSQITVGIR